MLEFVPVINQY